MVKSTQPISLLQRLSIEVGSQIPRFDSVVVRFGGEIGIKSEWTRNAYEKLLLKNIEKALKHYDISFDEIIRKRGRAYIETDKADEVASKLTQVFGISSVSPAVKTSSDMNGIVQASVEQASIMVRDDGSFAVRCRRVGTHSYSSMDVCRKVGEQILKKLKDRNPRVNLNDPQLTISIEIRDSEAYVFTETCRGAGGFPVGSQSKVVCLLSGGIDSPVACWLAMKRGCTMVPAYFDNTPFTDEKTTDRALTAAKKLFEWSIGYPRKVHVVPHGKNLEVFVKEAPRKLTCILCKRMMYRVAERIAETEKAEGIVTGEAIGEQASQTLTNLRVLDEAATKFPIHRPLLGFDKTETEALARKIGTYQISIQKAKACSAAPSLPSTQAKLELVKQVEGELEIEEMVEDSVGTARVVQV